MTTGKYDIDSKDFDLEDCMAQAQQGNPDAQVSIAYCYIRGSHGLKKDEAKGFEHLRQSAESGDGRSMAHLGECYEEGLGVEKNYVKAVEWFTLAAADEFADSQYYLGVCHYNGQGVPEDREKGIKLLRKAKYGGSKEARETLIILSE